MIVLVRFIHEFCLEVKVLINSTNVLCAEVPLHLRMMVCVEAAFGVLAGSKCYVVALWYFLVLVGGGGVMVVKVCLGGLVLLHLGRVCQRHLIHLNRLTRLALVADDQLGQLLVLERRSVARSGNLLAQLLLHVVKLVFEVVKSVVEIVEALLSLITHLFVLVWSPLQRRFLAFETKLIPFLGLI